MGEEIFNAQSSKFLKFSDVILLLTFVSISKQKLL